ncbi:MAG: cystathionine beta-lyase [Geminicoccaceae bacterium]|nr:cystathionine beta-lyase [Geminicoccaceae bacterium]MCX8101549.1 cystathionine beta-lyase [Geminicoccaceae bacterium]MDW8369140.1 cystathionine beta-lyase [Geminicoccaceae bacterium]
MRAAVAASFLLLASVAGAPAADYTPGRPLESHDGARLDYALKCKGCHGLWGQGTPGHVPRLERFVGLFTHLPEGRDYLMRVPGVARSVLDDARLTGVLNWVLATYGADQVAPGFAPFTVEEVAAARLRPLEDRKGRRDRMLAELRAKGLLSPEDDGIGRSPEPRDGAEAAR